MNHTDDADAGCIGFEVDRVRKTMEQHATDSTTNHREPLRGIGDLLHGGVELRQKRGRRLARARQIPVKRVRDLGPGLRLDANRRHLADPGAELVAERSPRNPRLGIGVSGRLATIELSRKIGGDRQKDGELNQQLHVLEQTLKG